MSRPGVSPRWWAAAVIFMAVGCGSAESPGPRPLPPQEALPQLSAPALALARGARWVLLAEPSRALSNPALRRAFDVLVPERRRVAWANRYGLDPIVVESVAVGEYADGVLLVARGPFTGTKVVKATAAAMDVVETSSEPPRPRVVGLVGSERYLLAAAAEDTLVLGQGAPATWHAVMRFVDGLSHVLPPTALDEAQLREAAGAEGAPLVWHLLEPLALPLETPLGVVLAGQTQLALALSSDDPAQIDVWLALAGEFPQTIEDNLRAVATSLAAEPLGAALGMAAALPSLRIEHVGPMVVLRLQLPSERFVQGLETLFGAELWHLLQGQNGPG